MRILKESEKEGTYDSLKAGVRELTHEIVRIVTPFIHYCYCYMYFVIVSESTRSSGLRSLIHHAYLMMNEQVELTYLNQVSHSVLVAQS